MHCDELIYFPEVCLDYSDYVWYGVEISIQCYKVIYKDLNYADNL